MAQDGGALRASSKSRREKVSTLVLLAREGLEEYYTYFQQAGFSMFDGDAHPSDLVVEQYLAETEKACGITFLPEVRIRLWKALRYQWFRGQTVAPFIERTQVRSLFLPKLDYKEVDNMVRIPDIDPDRRRQFIRTTRPSGQPSFRGPAVVNLQFEVYRRQDDIYHELQDVERCVTEWQNRNPRTMLSEDPREEIMRLRIRRVEEELALAVLSRRAVCTVQRRVRLLLVFLRMLMLAMAGVHAWAAYYRYQHAPKEVMLWFILGSNQFICCGCYFLAYMVAYVVALRWHHDSKSLKLQRLQHSCQRLTESISDFRVETEGQRMSPEENFEAGYGLGSKLPKAKTPKQKKERRRDKSRELALVEGESGARQRVKKPKREKDEVLAMWAGKNAHKRVTQEGMLALKKQVEESYKRLEQVHVPNQQRRDGNRVAETLNRVRPPESFEDKLCVRLPRAPKAPPPATRGLPRMLPPPGPGGAHTLMPAPPMLPPPPPDPSDLELSAVTRSFANRTGAEPSPRSPAHGILDRASGQAAEPAGPASQLPDGFAEGGPEDAGFDADAAARLAPWLPGRLPPRADGPGGPGGPEP